MRRWSWPAAAPLLMSFVIFPAAAQQSASYSMERITATAAASMTESPSYESRVLIGPAAPSGASSFCNDGYVNSLGFWAAFGDLPVPIRLRLGKNEGVPNRVELFWTGADGTFGLYRSLSASDILAPGNLRAQTGECSAIDHPSGANVFFYRLVGVSDE